VPGALSLALTPAPLLVAAVACALLVPGRRNVARLAAVIALAASIGLLAVDSVPAASGGRILASYGDALPGIAYLFRADATAMLIGFAAAAAGLLLLLEAPAPDPRTAGSLLLCVTGSIVAGAAGNAVMLFAGLEIANIGTFLLLAPSASRRSRAAVVALFVEHLASLGLLGAAANLQATLGTSDFSALPAGALTPAVAVPWALAAAGRLLSPAVVSLRLPAVTTATWAASAAIPTGAAALLRLREAAGGAMPAHAALTLAGIGAAAAIAGAVFALRHRTSPLRTGRGLCVTAAGLVLAVGGFQQPPAGLAAAAGLAFLQLVVALTAAWERSGGGVRSRLLRAGALLVAGGLPLGFGATAILLEVSAALGTGLRGAALVVTVVLASVLGAVAAASAAAVVLAGRVPGARDRPAPLAMAALVAAVAGAAVPGLVVARLNGAAGAGAVLANAGNAVVAVPTGGWAGGYVLAAALLLVVGAGAAWTLADRHPAAAGSVNEPAVAAGPRPATLRALRLIRRPRDRAGDVLTGLDAWLAQQPQLPLIAAGGLLAVIFIR